MAPTIPTHRAKKRSTGTIIVIVLGLIVFGLGTLAVGGLALLGANSRFVESTVPTTALIGECYERGNPTRSPVPCDGRHHYEVYSSIWFPQDMEYPNRLERLLGNDVCEEDFELYTGENYWTSDLEYSVPFPTEEEWNAGDRFTVCALHDAEFGALRGSKRR